MTTESPPSSALPLPRGLLIVLGLAATVIVIAGMKAAAGLIGPFFLALVLTIAAHPVGMALRRRGLPSWVGTVACGVVVYAILLGLALSLVIAGARFATLLPQYESDFDDVVDNVRGWLDDAGVDEERTSAMVSDFDLGRFADFATDLLGQLLGVVSNLAFIVTLLFFLVMDAAIFSGRLERARADRAPVVDALTSFAHGTRRYLVVSTVFGLIVAIGDTIALWALGVPAPLLWGLLSFITNYIPNVGFVIGLVPPAVLALLDGGVGLMIAVIAVYCVLNLVIQSFIQPKYVGDAVGLSTSLTFLSLVFWSWVLGPLGAFLAVPMSLFAKALLVDVDPASSWVRPLISGGRDDQRPESRPDQPT
jgi:AI-2 transport protein TqsA